MLEESAAWIAEQDGEKIDEPFTTRQASGANVAVATTNQSAAGTGPSGVDRHRVGRFRFLDVGCGTASFAMLLSRTGWPIEIVGMDYSPAMCVVATKKLGSAETSAQAGVLAGDSEHLPFADGSVDVLTCANSFHHYPRQGAVIREMRRVLRPGGRLILLDGFRDNAIGWFVFEVVVTAIEKDVHHATWREIDSMFTEAGFRNIRRRKFNVLFPVLMTTGDA